MSELPKVLPNPGALVQWPKGRLGHSTVFIDTSIGPHLLMVGGYNYGATNDCWLFDIIKKIWKQLVSIKRTYYLIVINILISLIILLYYYYNYSLVYQTLSLGDIIILSQCGVWHQPLTG